MKKQNKKCNKEHIEGKVLTRAQKRENRKRVKMKVSGKNVKKLSNIIKRNK